MKKLLSLLSVFVLVFAISGCGSNSEETADACAGDTSKVVMVTDAGGVNDKSFNQGTWEGIQRSCSELGITASYIESKSEADFDSNLTTAASQAEIVVASGFLFESAIAKIAVEYPEVQFILIDATPKNESGEEVVLPNVFSYFFNEAEAGYLVGYLAGETTTSNKIGFVGGLKIPPVEQFGLGFLQGVQASNPEAEVEYIYTNSFTDVTLGQQTANTMIAQGVDTLFTVAGGLNDGVVRAAIDSTNSGTKIDVIGVDRDMYADGLYTDSASGEEKSVILTSAVKYTGEASFTAIKTINEGGKPEAVNKLDFKSGAVGIPEENPNLVDKPEAIEAAKESLNLMLDNNTLLKTREEVQKILKIRVNGDY